MNTEIPDTHGKGRAIIYSPFIHQKLVDIINK